MRWWDKSWNPVTGCVPCSKGCDNCVALLNLQKQCRSLDPQFNETAFSKELQKGLNYMVASLGDLFDLEDWNKIDMIFKKMISTQESRFFLCTKKPDQLREYMEDAEWESNQMENIWLGTSIESQEYVYRVDELINTVEICHRYIQVEPMLGPISLKDYFETGAIEWIIIGCETGEGRREFNIEWAEDLIQEAKSFGVKVFVNWYNSDESGVTDNINLFPNSIRYRETPWEGFSEESERRDLLSGRVVEFKLPDGNVEIKCPVSIFWKLKAMIKNLNCFGYSFRGRDIQRCQYIEDAINSSIDIFHTLKCSEDIQKSIAWDFLPKEIICKCILTPQLLQKIANAKDKELNEIFKTTSIMME